MLEVVVLIPRMIDGHQRVDEGSELLRIDTGVLAHAFDAEESFKDNTSAFDKVFFREVVWFKVPSR